MIATATYLYVALKTTLTLILSHENIAHKMLLQLWVFYAF